MGSSTATPFDDKSLLREKFTTPGGNFYKKNPNTLRSFSTARNTWL